jgi:N6-adenosine-specific RNA methylase IME4
VIALPTLERLETLPPAKLKATATTVHNELRRRTDPLHIMQLAKMADAIEDLMHAAGLYKPQQIMPVNHDRMYARWKLGQALAKVERGHGPGRGKKDQHDAESFKSYLKTLELEWTAAQRAQRIGTLPSGELDKLFEEQRLLHFDELIVAARPYWYKASREQKHKKIVEVAKRKMTLERHGPFPLVYADPAWKFEIYSAKGLERTPDQHYPTLTDDEIANFKIDGLTVPEIAHKDAALLLWCTSSNMLRAADIMVNRWGFEYKTSAIWDKGKTGLGLVFRNQHEVLLYGTRGNMPGPQFQPPSVFHYPRGEHSAKPPEIRAAIEKMYPDFDEKTRLELFAREQVKGWTTYGYEALGEAA